MIIDDLFRELRYRFMHTRFIGTLKRKPITVEDMKFFDRAPRPLYCPYCGAPIKDDSDGGGYCMGGFGPTDTFGARCMKCGKICDVCMDPDNYTVEVFNDFQAHMFMRGLRQLFPPEEKDDGTK